MLKEREKSDILDKDKSATDTAEREDRHRCIGRTREEDNILRTFKHLTKTDRLRIEKWLKEKLTPRQIAGKLRVSIPTIYRELHRGEYERLNGQTWEMERSCINESEQRTKVYFAHPYSSWERGTNENNNGMIRRKHPKGTNFQGVSKEELKETEEWMNSYPRRILGYKSSHAVFTECLREIGIVA